MGTRGGARRTRTAPDYLHSAEWPEPRPRPGPPQPFYSQSSAGTATAAEAAAGKTTAATSGNSARRRASRELASAAGAEPGWAPFTLSRDRGGARWWEFPGCGLAGSARRGDRNFRRNVHVLIPSW